MDQRRALATALLLALPLSACSLSDDDDGTQFTNVAEQGDNDAPGDAQVLGQIRPGMGFRIEGSASFTDDAMGDEFDSFNITADGAQRVRVTLTHSGGVDMDLAFVDMATEAIRPPDNCDSATSPEICEVVLADAESVNVEAEAFQGGGTYTLIIESFTP